MTNKDKFEQVFGLKAYTDKCPFDYPIACLKCEFRNEKHCMESFWNSKYKDPIKLTDVPKIKLSNYKTITITEKELKDAFRSKENFNKFMWKYAKAKPFTDEEVQQEKELRLNER